MLVLQKIGGNHDDFSSPVKNWILRQLWENLLFVHWPVSAESLRPWIPANLEIDRFERQAWVGIVLFRMKSVHSRWFPFLSLSREFLEINLRTYVRYNGKPGVFFLSLDANNWLSLKTARIWYRLPYYRAQIEAEGYEDHIIYRGMRKLPAPPVEFQVNFNVFPEIFYAEEKALEHWLTERYSLFTFDRKNRIYCADIEHAPWPLQKAEGTILTNTFHQAYQIKPLDERPLFHYAEGLEARIGRLTKL
jgi:hypothetical protein